MPLNPTLATIRRNLPAVARSLGFSARVTSAYRSRSKQAWLYNRWLAGLQEYPVAPPGTSDHEKGLALDVVSTNLGKLVDLLTSVGLSWAGPNDPVHFSMIGPQIAAQPQKKKKSTVVHVAEELFTPPPLKMVQFFKDPIATVKENVELAIQVVLGGLF